MDLALLATLKQKLVNATQFSDVFSYFLDHFGEQPDFMGLGERTTDPFVEAVLLQVGQTLFGKAVDLTGLLLVQLPEHQFLHGAATLGGKLATVIYFEDVHMGLIALDWSAKETKFSRFRGQPLPRRNVVPSPN